MVILFALIVMRMTGAIVLNPMTGRSEIPALVKGALTFAFSLMLFMWTGGKLVAAPKTWFEFASMALRELLLGFTIGFGMELSMTVIRLGTAIVDYMMGLSMAQVYDPRSGAQMTVSSGLYTTFMMLVFLVNDGHLRFFQLVFGTADKIPFGAVHFTAELPQFMMKYYCECIIMGLQFAMPIIVIELLAEVAIGIMMRVVPQINIFAINFQVKIIVGLVMLFLLFAPLSDMIDRVWRDMFDRIIVIIDMMG
jgi:flagellar biosynthetic protein FliR